jgi:hypothetical protein
MAKLGCILPSGSDYCTPSINIFDNAQLLGYELDNSGLSQTWVKIAFTFIPALEPIQRPIQ